MIKIKHDQDQARSSPSIIKIKHDQVQAWSRPSMNLSVRPNFRFGSVVRQNHWFGQVRWFGRTSGSVNRTAYRTKTGKKNKKQHKLRPERHIWTSKIDKFLWWTDNFAKCCFIRKFCHALYFWLLKSYATNKEKAENIEFLSKIRIFGIYLVRFGTVRFGKKISGSVRFGGSVKILVRSYTIFLTLFFSWNKSCQKQNSSKLLHFHEFF